MENFRQFSFKKIGISQLQDHTGRSGGSVNAGDYVKILLVGRGGKVTVDFQDYQLEQDALFFISPGQFNAWDSEATGQILFYNRDFYCVEIHDKEVACDGILFHNVYDIPVVYLSASQSENITKILEEFRDEFSQQDSTTEEMLRILLKKIIILSTRIWKQANKIEGSEVNQEVEFSRKFSQLVEWFYQSHHTVSDYANLLKITPKALNKRIVKAHGAGPNEIIKKRIILEAKRLLVHTELSIKEIGYKLGYDDPSYFIRLFSNQVGKAPQHFRQQYRLGS